MQHIHYLWKSGEVTIDSFLSVLARRVERYPFRIDVWRDLVGGLGPVGIQTEKKTSELQSKRQGKKSKKKVGVCYIENCKVCGCLASGRCIDHKGLKRRKQAGDWWGDIDAQDDNGHNEVSSVGDRGRSKWWETRFFLPLSQSGISSAPVKDSSKTVHSVKHIIVDWMKGEKLNPTGLLSSLHGKEKKNSHREIRLNQKKGIGPGRGKWLEMDWLYDPDSIEEEDNSSSSKSGSDADENDASGSDIDENDTSGSDTDESDDDNNDRESWDTPKTHDDILPKHISQLFREENLETVLSINGSDFISSMYDPNHGTIQDACVCESLCLKVIVACHLWSAVHPFVIDAVWHLAKKCISFSQKTSENERCISSSHQHSNDIDHKNNCAFRGLIWLTSFGLNISQILQEKYTLCVKAEEKEEQLKNDSHCEDNAFDKSEFTYDFAPVF
mmetsp:Transcript_48738/g.73631  ORF Transcript_48738/g.73631 Transcript_48738/m.73631 type:complete len:443 (-) Transcript_48738:2216-3544(-)